MCELAVERRSDHQQAPPAYVMTGMGPHMMPHNKLLMRTRVLSAQNHLSGAHAVYRVKFLDMTRPGEARQCTLSPCCHVRAPSYTDRHAYRNSRSYHIIWSNNMRKRFTR